MSINNKAVNQYADLSYGETVPVVDDAELNTAVDAEYDWDTIESDWVQFETDKVVVIRFLTEGKKIVNSFGNQAVSFDVVADGKNKTLDVASNRFLTLIKKNRPITGKLFAVVRTGAGYETQYQMREEV